MNWYVVDTNFPKHSRNILNASFFPRRKYNAKYLIKSRIWEFYNMVIFFLSAKNSYATIEGYFLKLKLDEAKIWIKCIWFIKWIRSWNPLYNKTVRYHVTLSIQKCINIILIFLSVESSDLSFFTKYSLSATSKSFLRCEAYIYKNLT